MNAQCLYKWWSTLKSAVFESSSSLPPLLDKGDALVCDSVGKADYCQPISIAISPGIRYLSPTCHPPESRTSFVFRSMDVRRLLLDQAIGYVYTFAEDILNSSPCLGVVYLRLRRLGSFLAAGDWLMSLQFRKVHSPPQ